MRLSFSLCGAMGKVGKFVFVFNKVSLYLVWKSEISRPNRLSRGEPVMMAELSKKLEGVQNNRTRCKPREFHRQGGRKT